MPAPSDLLELKKRYLAVNFIGLAMIASVFAYAVVVEVVKRALAPFQGFAGLEAAQIQMVKYLFVALALGQFLLIRVVQKFLVSRVAQFLPQAAVISFALCEAVGLLGLVLFFLGGNPMDFYLFMLLSLFYFWFYFPKFRDWEAQAQAQESATKK